MTPKRWCPASDTQHVAWPLETSSERLSRKQKKKKGRTERKASEQSIQGRDGKWTYPLALSSVLSPVVRVHARAYDLPRVQLPHQALWQRLGKQGLTPWCDTSPKATHGWQSQRLLVALGVKPGRPRACVPSRSWRGASGCRLGRVRPRSLNQHRGQGRERVVQYRLSPRLGPSLVCGLPTRHSGPLPHTFPP